MEIILTHENADFDAVAGLLAASKLYPQASAVLPERLNQNVAQFLTLYRNGLRFATQSDIRGVVVERIILVDTQRLPQIKGLARNIAIHILEHHPLAQELQANQTFHYEPVGAVTTLLVEQIREQGLKLSSMEATLLALGIYEDTGSMTYGSTTARDLHAAGWLAEQGAVVDTVRRFLTTPLNPDQQDLLDGLLKNSESRIIEGHTVVVATATADEYISEISAVVNRVRDRLEGAALFVLVEMPNRLQLVARSADDGIDVGEIARFFGGGGHGRAAAAAVHEQNLTESLNRLWQLLGEHVRPARRVADLMSFGAETVQAEQKLDEVVSRLRRIGHEGYPVVENGHVTGLLTRRDLDRAVEHGLNGLTVGEIMMKGEVTLQAHDAISTLEQRMVESGWGQIPVVDDKGRLAGIVTRTDLIQHWGQIHPGQVDKAAPPGLAGEQIGRVLGSEAAALIECIGAQAQKKAIGLYLVGGAVRDLLLERPNLDIDFVVEGDAIAFVRSLESELGGHIHAFPPFGTAKWVLDGQAAEKLKLDLTVLPESVDFASARNEFYEHPTALPTVYNSSIKLDLQRRDFTINTLAVQLSPAEKDGRILDFYGGLDDLRTGTLRALHSLSFIDDPTRILRAVRFKQRLGFAIEARTEELIASGLPMLGRITGERLRNELTLLLQEDTPEQGLAELQARGALKAIHPAFDLDGRIGVRFAAARDMAKPWPVEDFDLYDLYWHLLAACMLPKAVEAWAERLLFGRGMSESLAGAARVVEQKALLSAAEIRPSQIVERLEGIPELAVLAGWYAMDDPLAQERLRIYWTTWRGVRPITNGHTLREMGLKAGPCYRIILSRLRDAWLDGEVGDEAGEKRLLRGLIEDEKVCDERLMSSS